LKEEYFLIFLIPLKEDLARKDVQEKIEEIVKMPLLKCKGKNCQHEYESYDDNPICDWCDSTEYYVLTKETPLEKMCKSNIITDLLEIMKRDN